MMPPSQSTTTGAPSRGRSATSKPARISTPPTTYMKSWALPGIRLSTQPARYFGQSVRTLKNLSSPNRIGATVNAARSIRNAS